jgi:MOSC domain-containing protein YiiM
VGDDVADHRGHGGPQKSVYAYPHEHYPLWTVELGDAPLPVGVFGENLTVEGLSEEAVRIGDVLGIGSAELVVKRPRMPCVKLNARFERDDMIDRMLANGRSGFYLGVRATGSLRAGDEIRLVDRLPAAPTVLEDFRRRAHSA